MRVLASWVEAHRLSREEGWEVLPGLEVNSSGQLLQRINDTNMGPLNLNPVPPGLARQAYFAFDREWQKKLIEHARTVDLWGGLRPIPVTFTYDDLRAPADPAEESVFKKFQGLTCKGQLIPRLRVLAVMIDKAALASAPATLQARQGAERLELHAAKAPIVLTVDGDKTADFVVYAAAGPKVKAGTWVVKVPAEAIGSSWRRRDAENLDVERTIQVAFAVHTLFGDFDFHQIEFPSIEQALLTHFVERYAHLTASDEAPSDKPGQAAYAEAAAALVRLRAGLVLADTKKKMVAGFVNADASSRGRQVALAALGAVRDANDKEVSEVAAVGASILAQAYQAKGVIDSWKAVLDKMRITRDMAGALKLTEAIMDAKQVEGVFHWYDWNKWRDTVVKSIRDSEQKKANLLGKYLLFCKENADKALLEKLMKDACSPRLSAFEKLCGGAVAAKALWGLDTAVTIEQLAETIAAVVNLRGSEEAQAARLHKHLEEYGKQFKGAPCTEAVARLEVLRKAADAAVEATDEKTAEMVELAAKQTLRALTLVPVVGEFAALVSLAIETLEALTSVVDTASDMIDRFTWRHRSSLKRFSELAKLHAIQCRAIANSKDGPNDPQTQFRMRMIVLIGLLRLIERCGARHVEKEGEQGKDADVFARKVAQYQIGRYLSQYVFSRKPFTIAVNGGTPLDEIWTYACGNRETSWNDVIAAITSTGSTLTELVRGTGRAIVPVSFQKYFPVHGMESKNAEQLARVFSLNFAGVIDKALVYSRVYVRQKAKDPWVAAEQAGFPVEPGTAVRVVGIFQSKDDLTGVPMSLQIKRVDPIFKIDGPVYKSSLTPVTAALGGDVDDKGLLAYLDGEKQFIGKADTYSCVFYPFYFFQKHLSYGIKPFGFIGLSGNITLDFAFDLKAGDDGKYVRTGNQGDTSVRMHMTTSNHVHVDMILNREFLDHKTSEPNYENLFNFPWNTMQVGGVYLRGGENKAWLRADEETSWYSGQPYTESKPDADQFGWGKPFEMLVIFGAPFAAWHRWPEDPIRFPARIYVKEPHCFGLLENDGPSYPVEVYSLCKGQSMRAMSLQALQQELQRAGVLANGLDLVVKTRNVARGIVDNAGGIALRSPCSLWAVRVAFNYHVEGPDGLMKDKRGLRPFGEDYLLAGKGEEYRYHFDIRSPTAIGLDLRDFIRLTVPGLPDNFLSDTALAGDKDWVTNKALWPMTELEKLKLRR